MKAIILLLTLTAAALAQLSAPIKDSHDGKTYRTVKIGEQVWMAENLNYEIKGSKCYDNKKENCEKYGRLYNWAAAMKACPNGWHLPSATEWEILYEYIGKGKGEKLKTTSGWSHCEGCSFVGVKKQWYPGNGTDEYGFSALPGGIGYPTSGFGYLGESGKWWTTSDKMKTVDTHQNLEGIAVYWFMQADSRHLDVHISNKPYFYSVRCVRD